MVKIAITGSFGVGKTTLANDLAKVTGYKLLHEVARQMIKEGYRLDQNVTEETEYELLKRQEKLEKTKGSWIADRCLIDCLAYVKILLKKNVDLIKAIRDELNKAEYDLIIYLKPEFPLKGDGARSAVKKFQKDIDQMIEKIIRNSGMRWYRVSGSPINRVNKVLKII